MKNISILIFVALFVLTGCASPGLYSWGEYERGLYSAYKDPGEVEALRLKLEAHIAAMETVQQKVAPGLYAELGTLYYQKGDTDKAKYYYTKEYDAWPESRGLMNALKSNMERRDSVALDQHAAKGDGK